MAKVYSKALDHSIEVQRLIGQLQGEEAGPSIIFTGGIHGNEPAGVFALRRVLGEIRCKRIPLHGNIYALSGNLWALERGERYHKADLNRLWTTGRMEHLMEGKLELSSEDVVAQVDIFQRIREILATEKGPFYFMDIHTTSSSTTPFLTVNDSLLNRRFTSQYPVPVILGIEEYLDGPILSYINELGYVAFGFEGGQHDSQAAIENSVAFIYLSMVFAGILEAGDIDFHHYYSKLARNPVTSQGMYEIYDRHSIARGEHFSMKPGYHNFQKIRKGEEVATSDGKPVRAAENAMIFMPLYQWRGEDGFFVIRRIRPFFLRLSAILRRAGFDRWLPLLPGVNWANEKHDSLRVNLKIARFMAREFFHLMGYRSRHHLKGYLLVKSREAASRDEEYRQADWYREVK